MRYVVPAPLKPLARKFGMHPLNLVSKLIQYHYIAIYFNKSNQKACKLSYYCYLCVNLFVDLPKRQGYTGQTLKNIDYTFQNNRSVHEIDFYR